MLEFSVIIPSVNGLPIIGECLTSIEQQICKYEFEVIVVDRTKNLTAEYIGENFPRVKLIEVPFDCGIPEMRFIAMKQAVGEFLVVTEDHCLVPENWLEMIAEAHQRGYQIVGGAVRNISCRRLVDRAAFLCEYSAFMPPAAAGEVEFLSGNNISYKRSVIESLPDSLVKNYWEYFLLIELRRRKIKFFSVASLIVDHKKQFDFLYFLAQRFYYSRSFAAMRKQKASFPKQILYLLYTLLLPFDQIWRIFQNTRKKENYRDFFLAFHYLLIFMISYALGEMIGYLFGNGRSLSKVE